MDNHETSLTAPADPLAGYLSTSIDENEGILSGFVEDHQLEPDLGLVEDDQSAFEKDDGLLEPIESQPIIRQEVAEIAPAITRMRTYEAPSKTRLSAVLDLVEKQSRPVLPSTALFLEYPEPNFAYESSVTDPSTSYVGMLSPEAYWKRVDTFSTVNWFGKPLPLSPLQCARFGWKLRISDSLICEYCKKQLIYQNTDPTDLVSYIDLFLELMQSTHTEKCPFKHHPIPSSIFSIRSRPSTSVTHSFYERLSALKTFYYSLNIGCDLRLNIDLQSISSFTESNDVDFEAMCIASCPNDVIPMQHKLALVALALTGWLPQQLPKLTSSASTPGLRRISKSTTPHFSVKCLYCRRKLFPNFSAISAESLPEESPTSSNPKRFKLDEMTDINPTGDHRPHCPWINPIENEKHLGWQIVLRSLVLSLEKSQSIETPQSSLAEPNSSFEVANSSSVLSRVARTLDLVMALNKH